MKISEKGKQTVLIIAIIAVVVIGFVLLNKTGKEDNEKQEVSKNATDTEEGELHYKEESRGEEVFEDIKYIKFLKFKDKPVRLSKIPKITRCLLWI